MTIIRWAPLRELNTIQREMDRLLDRVQEKWEYPETDYIPAAEMLNAEGYIYINLELPGLNPQEIDIQATAETVTVTGERQAPESNAANTRSEFHYGKFHRTIALPEKIQNDQVAAKYDQGILRLTLPKVVEAVTKVVKVDVGG